MVVLGHAGAGFPSIHNHYPTNSEESIKQALLIHNANGVEVDVQLTKDNELVLYHDDRLETGTNDSGYVSAMVLNDLLKLKRRGNGTIIHETINLYSLKELLQFITENNLNVWLSLNLQNQEEIEDRNAYKLAAFNAFKDCLKDYKFIDKVIVETRDIETLETLGELKLYVDPEINIFVTGAISEEKVNTLKDARITGFVTNYIDETEETVALAKNNGYDVVFYGLKIRQDIPRALKLKPDMVQTDNIPLTFSYLD